MIKVCLKCNAFYADESLSFCLADGTPLVNLDPSSDQWSEGLRVIKENENSKRQTKRKQKWRRLVMSTLSTMMIIMVVYVVAINGIIYLKPPPENDSPAIPPPVEITPTPTPTPQNSPTFQATPSPTATPTVTPSPRPTVTPSPTPTVTPSPTPTPTPECSESDKSREKKVIGDKFDDTWRKNASTNQPKIDDEKTPIGIVHPEISLSKVDMKTTLKTCTSASVTVTYVWRVLIVRTKQNGRPEVRTVETKRQFNYLKSGGSWHPR